MERSAWTDERLDDRFDHIDAELRALRAEIAEQGSALRGEIAELGSSLRGEIADLRATMLRLYGGNLIAMFGLVAAILIRGA